MLDPDYTRRIAHAIARRCTHTPVSIKCRIAADEHFSPSTCDEDYDRCTPSFALYNTLVTLHLQTLALCGLCSWKWSDEVHSSRTKVCPQWAFRYTEQERAPTSVRNPNECTARVTTCSLAQVYISTSIEGRLSTALYPPQWWHYIIRPGRGALGWGC
jgi:hypothetical protein